MTYKRGEYIKAKIHNHFVTLRIPHEMHERVKSFAKDQKLSEAEAYRTLVEWGLIENSRDPKD
jgi:predicted DNA-binding protein